MSHVIPLPRLQIRRGTSADREPVTGLVESVWRETYSAHLPDEDLRGRSRDFFQDLAADPGDRGWVAVLGKQVVGYGCVAANCVEQLWVSARMRRRGVASALLDAMLASIRARGFAFAQAGCEDFNLPARRFLEAKGWEQIASERRSLGSGRDYDVLVHSIALHRDAG